MPTNQNHPRRTAEESRSLSAAGWFPFPELNEAENDEIFVARLVGFAPCYPAYPSAEEQAQRTLRAAREYSAKLA